MSVVLDVKVLHVPIEHTIIFSIMLLFDWNRLGTIYCQGYCLINIVI